MSLAPIFRGQRSTLGERMLVINYSRMPMFKVTYTQGNPAMPQRDGAAVLWKHWRLLENRELYDMRRDLHQDHNVAAAHPEVVSKMRAHLEAWWDEVRSREIQERVAVIAGIQPLPNAESAKAYAEKRPSPRVPDAVLERICGKASDNEQRKAGIEIAVETIEKLSLYEGLRGFGIQGDGDDEAALHVLEKAGLETR